MRPSRFGEGPLICRAQDQESTNAGRCYEESETAAAVTRHLLSPSWYTGDILGAFIGTTFALANLKVCKGRERNGAGTPAIGAR